MKLGTITPEGTADLFCYDCDDTVLDTQLSKHLHHFGIDIGDQRATERTVADAEREMNANANFNSAVDGDGKQAELVYGPGYTGLQNLGSSCRTHQHAGDRARRTESAEGMTCMASSCLCVCRAGYMASVLQVLFSLPSFQQRYLTQGQEHMATCRNNRPAECYQCQMAKLAHGMLSGHYSAHPTHAADVDMRDAGADDAGEHKKRKLVCSINVLHECMHVFIAVLPFILVLHHHVVCAWLYLRTGR